MSKFIVTNTFDNDALGISLCNAAGVDPKSVRRMVLDLQVGNAGCLYLETFADDAILDVSVAGLVQIKEEPECCPMCWRTDGTHVPGCDVERYIESLRAVRG